MFRHVTVAIGRRALAVAILAALARVRCPTLIVHATRPWIDGRPYLTDAIIDTQRTAVPHAAVFRARRSNHPMLLWDPESDMVDSLRRFVLSVRAGDSRSMSECVSR